MTSGGNVDPIERVVGQLEAMDALLDQRVQRIFDQHGPARDRHTRWDACGEEPWVSLARVLDVPALFTDALVDDLS